MSQSVHEKLTQNVHELVTDIHHGRVVILRELLYDANKSHYSFCHTVFVFSVMNNFQLVVKSKAVKYNIDNT
jgi:hypothetical protein